MQKWEKVNVEPAKKPGMNSIDYIFADGADTLRFPASLVRKERIDTFRSCNVFRKGQLLGFQFLKDETGDFRLVLRRRGNWTGVVIRSRPLFRELGFPRGYFRIIRDDALLVADLSPLGQLEVKKVAVQVNTLNDENT